MLRHLAFPMLLSALALTACGDDDPAGPGPGEPLPVPVASIELATPPDLLELGRSVRLTAVPRSATGQALTGRAIAWGSSDDAIATIDATGLLSAVAEGEVLVTATSEGKQAAHRVRVEAVPAVVAQVVILDGDRADLRIGQAIAARVEARDAQGRVIGGKLPAWRTTDAAVAQLLEDGRIGAVFTGSAAVIATIDGVADTLYVHVTPNVQRIELDPAELAILVGAQRPLRAIVRGDGDAVLDAAVTWSSQDESVVTVDAAGTLTARGRGITTISASAEGVLGQALVVVLSATDFDASLVNGQALPTEMFSIAQDGVTATYRVQSASLRLIEDGRYEQSFDFLIFRPDRPMDQGRYVLGGEVSEDHASGELVFTPSDPQRPLFQGTRMADGGLLVHQRFEANATEATLMYRER